MKKLLGYPSVQIALCLAAFALVGWKFGPFGIVLTSPLLAAAIARPVINLVGNIRHAARERVWLPVHGEHFVFKDITIHVLEDEDHWRWIPVPEARKVGGVAASDGALQAMFAERVQAMGKPKGLFIRDDALVEYLSKSTDAAALRFRTWVDRTVALPARTIRERQGVRRKDDAD